MSELKFARSACVVVEDSSASARLLKVVNMSSERLRAIVNVSFCAGIPVRLMFAPLKEIVLFAVYVPVATTVAALSTISESPLAQAKRRGSAAATQCVG